jgi:hypothetical protein
MRNEDYDRELLVTITLICVALASVIGAFETTTAAVTQAGAHSPPRVEQLAPVRVIGTPFVLNTNPSAR